MRLLNTPCLLEQGALRMLLRQGWCYGEFGRAADLLRAAGPRHEQQHLVGGARRELRSVSLSLAARRHRSSSAGRVEPDTDCPGGLLSHVVERRAGRKDADPAVR